MQLPKRLELNERQCPVPDTVFSQLHKSNPAEAALIAATLPERQRAQLAAFCYKRKHLSHLAIMIAANCDKRSLETAMGRAGEQLFEQSRDATKAVATLREQEGENARKAISLATFGKKSSRLYEDEAINSDTNIVPLRR